MTNEEINRAVAEHVGTADRWLIVKRGYFYRPEAKGYTSSESEAWKLPLVEAKRYEYLIGDEPVTLSRASIPNYAGDLNAMHEAEQQGLKTQEEKMECGMILLDVCAPGEPVTVIYAIAVIACATAHQRAEAFLRTVGKWKEVQ